MELRGILIPLKGLEGLKERIKSLEGLYWYYYEMPDKILYGRDTPSKLTDLGYKGRIFRKEVEFRWEEDNAWELSESQEGQFERGDDIRLFVEPDWRRFPGTFIGWRRVRARKYLKDGLIQLLRFMEVEEDEEGKR